MHHSRLGIVIPTLNEERALAENLPLAMARGLDVVVSDGGSGDRTRQIALELGARLVEGSPGRGPQLNRGAAELNSDVLLFLHADTRLPEGAREAVLEAVSQEAVGGAFLVAFDEPRGIMALGARLINLRTRLTRVPLGDQAQFATRVAFEALGGFRDWPLLEDLDFARRLKAYGRLIILPEKVTTAARRYRQRGVLRTVASNWLIWLLFLGGADPSTLARVYRQIR